jgi:hypothetical protein
MSFTPDTSRGYDEDSSYTYAAKVVPSEQGCIDVSNLLDVRNLDGVCSQNGAQRGAEHRHERQDRENQIASP